MKEEIGEARSEWNRTRPSIHARKRLQAGSGGFILQRYYQKEWAENYMMQLMVDDLDAWWTHIEGLDLPGHFDVQPPRAPAMQPWGLRVAYLFDPCGVLWHIAERHDDGSAPRPS